MLKIARTTAAIAGFLLATPAIGDPLPSWNDTDARTRIIDFVDAVTDPDGADYVTPAARIAVFDNDGTLWAEQPVYFQLLFAIDQIGVMAQDDPSILTSDTLKAAAKGDIKAVVAGGKDAMLEILTTTHANTSVSAFKDAVRDWLASARHPDTGLPYDQMTYQPMVELLSYLRDEGFKTYIVSGGGIDFMRAFAETAYGIPPEQVVGSSGKTSYKVIDGVATLIKDPAIAFIDDNVGKPIGINNHIGRRPIFVGGNSDGDFEMLEWSTSGDGRRFGLIVHHTDATREYAYDRGSHIGKLERGLDEASRRGWLIVDMARDWARVYTGQR